VPNDGLGPPRVGDRCRVIKASMWARAEDRAGNLVVGDTFTVVRVRGVRADGGPGVEFRTYEGNLHTFPIGDVEVIARASGEDAPQEFRSGDLVHVVSKPISAHNPHHAGYLQRGHVIQVSHAEDRWIHYDLPGGGTQSIHATDCRLLWRSDDAEIIPGCTVTVLRNNVSARKQHIGALLEVGDHLRVLRTDGKSVWYKRVNDGYGQEHNIPYKDVRRDGCDDVFKDCRARDVVVVKNPHGCMHPDGHRQLRKGDMVTVSNRDSCGIAYKYINAEGKLALAWLDHRDIVLYRRPVAGGAGPRRKKPKKSSRYPMKAMSTGRTKTVSETKEGACDAMQSFNANREEYIKLLEAHFTKCEAAKKEADASIAAALKEGSAKITERVEKAPTSHVSADVKVATYSGPNIANLAAHIATLKRCCDEVVEVDAREDQQYFAEPSVNMDRHAQVTLSM